MSRDDNDMHLYEIINAVASVNWPHEFRANFRIDINYEHYKHVQY